MKAVLAKNNQATKTRVGPNKLRLCSTNSKALFALITVAKGRGGYFKIPRWRLTKPSQMITGGIKRGLQFLTVDLNKTKSGIKIRGGNKHYS